MAKITLKDSFAWTFSFSFYTAFLICLAYLLLVDELPLGQIGNIFIASILVGFFAGIISSVCCAITWILMIASRSIKKFFTRQVNFPII
jgi:hypothetical protein